MVELGEHQKLREVRMFFQHASDDESVAVAEEATGRKVRSFVSGIDTERDVSSEVFYFRAREELDEAVPLVIRSICGYADSAG